MHTVHKRRLPCSKPRIVGIVAASASVITTRAATSQPGAVPPSVKACQPPARVFAALPSGLLAALSPDGTTGSFFFAAGAAIYFAASGQVRPFAESAPTYF